MDDDDENIPKKKHHGAEAQEGVGVTYTGSTMNRANGNSKICMYVYLYIYICDKWKVRLDK